MNPNLSNKNQGAALVITMIIVAVILAISLSFGRIMISEIKISDTVADGAVAYYAAEGGIEEGLLGYRKNVDQNYQVGRALGDVNDVLDHTHTLFESANSLVTE